MMATILPPLPSRPERREHMTGRTRGRVANWAAGILLFYIVYLGMILPFVCWGAMGTPGHPHPVAHFVFTVPEIPHPGHPQISDHEPTHTPEPTGQSRPDTTLISLILLVFVGMWLGFGPAPHGFSHPLAVHNWRSVVLPIPTPPPRGWMADFGLQIAGQTAG